MTWRRQLIHSCWVLSWYLTGKKSWWSQRENYHPEHSGLLEGIGQQEAYEAQQGQMQSPAPGNNYLQQYRLEVDLLESRFVGKDPAVLVYWQQAEWEPLCLGRKEDSLGYFNRSTVSTSREMIVSRICYTISRIQRPVLGCAVTRKTSVNWRKVHWDDQGADAMCGEAEVTGFSRGGRSTSAAFWYL